MRNRNLPLVSLGRINSFAELNNVHLVVWVPAGHTHHKWPAYTLTLCIHKPRWPLQSPSTTLSLLPFTSSGPSCLLEAKTPVFYQGLSSSSLAQFFQRVPKCPLLLSYCLPQLGSRGAQILIRVVIHTYMQIVDMPPSLVFWWGFLSQQTTP